MEKMDLTKECLIDDIVNLRIRIENDNRLLTKYLKECQKIERKLLKRDYRPDKLVNFKYEIIRLNKKINNTEEADKIKFSNTSIFLIMFYGIAILLYKRIESTGLDLKFDDFFTHDFANFVVFSLIGMLGALARMYSKGVNGEDDLRFRLLMSIIFPVVFVCLFVYNGDSITGFSKINIIMFAGGFSTEFVLGILDKIMEIAKKAINIDGKNNDDEMEERLTKIENLINNNATSESEADKSISA
ncbi:hypothetical protein [Paenibacillus sp. CGMCC 1.18879]|uniref:hypothetical protein n=1 Tax=Paenibacillus sp. CGMCC 1.18879 TaxID=2834466 RepID=UPI001CA84B49|nr:hypothetical protein [Paenibacillus sp. CGMCC 1.18879]MBY9080963.1 hypothetical protein [Paenibacillus sp. CGMCC 1.18879]